MPVGESVGDFIGEIVFNYFLKIPGAALRWIFLHKKRSFQSLLNDQWVNTMTTLLLIGIVIVLLILLE